MSKLSHPVFFMENGSDKGIPARRKVIKKKRKGKPFSGGRNVKDACVCFERSSG